MVFLTTKTAQQSTNLFVKVKSNAAAYLQNKEQQQKNLRQQAQ